MKLSKKIGCVLLAVLMLATSLTAGFAAVAASARYDELINAIKEGQTTIRADYDFYVKDLTNYTVENVSDDWSEEGNTLSYRHVVTAKDNYAGDIQKAATWFYAVVDDLVSNEYGVGSYNTALLATEIKTALYERMTGADHMLRTDATGDSVYVPVQGVTVNQGMTDAIEIDELSSAQVRASVFPSNASNQTVFWRVISGTDVVAVDQNGRVYAKQPGSATLECVAVDSLEVVTPAVYNEDGEIIQAPTISFDNAEYAQFFVTVNNYTFTEAELQDMLSQFTNEDGSAITPPSDLTQLEELVREKTIETLPDYGRTNNDVLADLAALVPANLEADEAETIRELLDAENRSDADYATLASFCYSAVQEAVLSAHNIDIADLDLENLSSSGIDAATVTAIREIITEQAEAVYDECGYTDEYHFFNIDALVNYFLGSSNVINAANWYHTFSFEVKTDLETAMMDIFDRYGNITVVGSRYDITVNTNTYTWQHRREYDASGTEARYVIDGTYNHTSSSDTDGTAFDELADVNVAFDSLYAALPSDIASYNSAEAQAFIRDFDFDTQNDQYDLEAVMQALWNRGYSSELLSAAFGNKYYWINTIYNLCRPNYTYDQAVDAGMNVSVTAKYAELYTYRENVRSNPDGSSVPYAMTSDRINQIVDTIDAMLLDENIADVISTFFNFNDPKYLGTAVYGQEFDTLQEMLQLLIQSFLYTGDIPTLILQKLYPLMTDLIHNTVMDALHGVSVPLWGDLVGLIDSFNDSQDASVEVTLIRALNSIEAYIYPYEYAESWPQEWIDRYPEVYNVLHQDRLRPSGKTNDSNVPKGYDYRGSRENVGWDQITEEEWEIISRGWGVSTRDQFEKALAVSLNSFLPLLATILGDQDLPVSVINITITVKNLNGYRALIAPLFDALGISATRVDAFNSICRGTDRTAILEAITTPLLNWVENEVLVHPIESVANLLVNLSSLLSYTGESADSGNWHKRQGDYDNFVEYAIDQLGPNGDYATEVVALNVIGIADIQIFDGPGLYGLIADMLPEGMDLGSLNGILSGLDLFNAPIVLRYNDFGEPVFQQTTYDDNGNILSVTDTTDESLADTQALSLPAIQEGKLKEAGTVVQRYTSPTNDWTYSNVHYENVEPGQILLYLFRYIFYGIMSTPYTGDDAAWETQPSLLDAFLPPWQRNSELIAGVDLTIDGIINNIIYNPEEALCALMELLAPNETGSMTSFMQALQNGSDPDSVNVYEQEYPDYQQEILLARDAEGNLIHQSFGARVNYTKYWTRSNAEDTVENLEEIVANVLSMLGMGTIEELLTDLINDNLFTNEILSTLANLIYTSLQSLQTTVDLQTILDAAFDVNYDVNTLYNTLAYNMYLKYGFTELGNAPQILLTMYNAIRSGGMGGVEWSRDLFYQEVAVVDENGDPVMETVFVTDEDGNKIQMVDVNGEAVYDAEGNPVYLTREQQVVEERAVDWGLDGYTDAQGNYHDALVGQTTADGTHIITREDLFFDSLTALLSPLALIFQRLFMGDNLSVFTGTEYPNGLLTIPMYQIYYYAIIPLFEALGMPDIVSYEQAAQDLSNRQAISTGGTALAAPAGSSTGATMGDVQFFADVVSPVRGLLNKALADPISTVLDLVPNLLFYVSVGALNDTLNNILHFAYVLLDILEPIVDVVPIVNNLLAGLEVAGIQLNLSLPLEIDFNTLINQLIGSFTEGTLLEGPLQGAGGIEVTDGLYIKIPPIDLSMLCVGTINPFQSVSNNEIVKIGTGDGADLITVVLQLVMEVLFMYDNWENVSLWLADMGMMDGFDTETIYTIFTELNKMANEEEMPDKAMNLIYLLLKYLAPISGELAGRLDNMDMTIVEFFDQLQASDNPIDLILDLLKAGEEEEGDHQIETAKSFFQRLIDFFKKIIAALRRLFGLD